MNIFARISFFKKIAFESTEKSPPSEPPRSRSRIELGDPSIAHEGWLIDSLRAAFEQEDSNIEKFVVENREAISNLRRSFQQTPRLLGAGKDGVAFDIGGEKVLKIFSNQFAYEKAVQAVNILHSAKPIARTEAMVYDAGILGYLPNGKAVFFSLIEKMQPVSENPVAALFLKKLLKLTKDAIVTEPIKSKIDLLRGSKVKSHKRVKEIASMLKSKIIEDVGEGQIENIKNSLIDEMNLRENWLDNYLEEIISKAITHRFDLHIKNVGATTTGQMRYFDSAYLQGSSDESEIDPSDKSLSKAVSLHKLQLDSKESSSY